MSIPQNKIDSDSCLNPSPKIQQIQDPPSAACGPTPDESLRNVAAEFHAKPNQKVGYGHSAQCDPMQLGRIVEDMKAPPKRVKDGSIIYRYSKAIRGCDEAMKELFSDLICINEMGENIPVPIIWGTQERAVSHVLQNNVRNDSTLVVNRIPLPILSIYQSGMNVTQDRYIYHGAINYMRNEDGKPGMTTREGRHDRDTVFGVARGRPIDVSYQLTAWTLYLEDMNQILEQVISKFSPLAYISIQGVHNWETTVRLESVASNLETEPGDQQVRVIKYQFSMTVETFIPQPIVRKKAVLDQRIDVVDKTSDEEITEVISRMRNVVEGLE